MADAKSNNGFPKWLQSIIGGLAVLGIAGGISLAIAQSSLKTQVDVLKENVKPVAANATKVAVIEADLTNIKEDVSEVKGDVKTILTELRRINGGPQ